MLVSRLIVSKVLGQYWRVRRLMYSEGKELGLCDENVPGKS